MSEREELIKQAFHKLFLYNCDNYIFVYTPPKVGSTTLVTSLRVSLGKTYNVIHIHDDVMLNVLTGINVKVNEIIQYIADQGKNIFVFDVYRSPVERKISEFFEKISPYHFNNTETNISKYNVHRIINRFNKLFPFLADKEHYFDQYSVDIPAPFQFDKKYTVQTINKVKYVKLRLLDSAEWGRILSEVLQTSIVLIQDYQTADKDIGDFYRRFKEAYRLPQNFYELLEKDRYLTFYYSSKERREYLESWKTKVGDYFIPYTQDEFKFYINLCLENQYYNDIQFDHYIDNGCFCKNCSLKRKEIYFKALNNEKVTEKIIHREIVAEKIKEKRQKIIQTIHVANNVQKAKQALNNRRHQNSKFLLNVHL